VLDAYRPDIVLIEGPPEADPLVPLVGHEQMRPPVALLAYPAGLGKSAGTGRQAAFWPFAEFSPEWQALRWAVRYRVPTKFFDLPTTYRFARDEPVLEGGTHADPLGELAAAAGYDDPERWWEDVVEHRLEAATEGADEIERALAPFQAIAEAMGSVRAASPEPSEVERLDEERREAYMRTVLRGAMKQYQRIAVVCGAWHVPALTAPLPPASHDTKTLRGLPKAKVAMTWVPWTHGRLASWQGYGAGVSSPGWYHHLFTAPDRVIPRWMVEVATVLREEQVPTSSAHLIEAVRFAETLAALRNRPLAGLTEVTEATRAVLCDGDELKVALVARRLVVGERLGAVPDDTPSVPLVRDLAAAQKRLRMPPEASVKEVDLDLRRDIDLDRSRLLHRLRLLAIAWGEPGEPRRGKGTFWESWRLAWQPEFAVDLVEASAYGTTVEDAATARAREAADAARTLGEVTRLLERCLLADLPDAFGTVLRALDERMALDNDVAHLMSALPALARTLRYGDVRDTDTGALVTVTAGLVVRICVGLPTTVISLDEDAAQEARERIDGVHAALALLENAELRSRWLDTLDRLARRDDLPGLLAGRMNRMLLDAGRLDADEAGRRMGLVLTVGVAPAVAAAWIEGFLAGGGLLLVHDERLLRLVDGWLAGIRDDAFVEVLPLLRRTFSQFAPAERRSIGERAARLDTSAAANAADDDDIDTDRAAVVLPTVATLLGWPELSTMEL
jgi:hypothetical protein